MAKVSLEKDKIKFLLVEGVHQSALENLRAAGYTNIEFHKGALDSDALKASIRDAHFIGIRSRSQLTEEILRRLKSWSPLAVSVSVPTRLICRRLPAGVFPCSMRRSQIPARLRSW